MPSFSFSGEERCEVIAQYIIETGATVRSAAEHFGVSKSTVHKDVTDRLHSCNLPLYREVQKILCLNKAERHLRGGEATRRKYLLIREIVRKQKDGSGKVPKPL